nr:MAG TPA: hypothetical protein [Caudoviricetes sp.]
MKYKALKPLIYSGVSYEEGAEVDILEKSVVKSCIERELIEEIKDTTEKAVSETPINEDNQDKKSSEIIIEDNKDTEKDDKQNKKNK